MDISLNSEILRTLKCPSCLQYMTTGIYECISGHSVCSLCSIKTCPICKSAFTDTRNFSLENISKLLRYPCPNEPKGCREKLQTEELTEHVQSCDYRSYNCKLDKQCFWQGRRIDLKNHYFDKHDHKILVGDENVCLWKQDKPKHSIHLLIAFNETFYIHRKLKNDIMYWTVQYIGRTEDIILFCFEVELFTDQFNDRKMTFSEVCHDDMKEDIDEIIESGFCVAIPMSVLDTYINTQGVIFFKIKIKRA